MLMKIDGILNGAELVRLREQLKDVKFDDGKISAGATVREVKNNLQTLPVDKALDEPRAALTAALLRHELFNQYVLPHRVMPAMFNRYDTGMDYGSHVDNAIMGVGEQLRVDVSVTVFLTDPADYDGGELVIHSDGVAQAVKFPAGSAVVYDSDTLHKVQPVTRGSRLCGVTWVQSLVRDSARREMLFELMQLARWARGTAPGSPEAMKIAKVRTNLMRLWAEV